MPIGIYAQLFVPGPLPGLNEIVEAAATTRRIEGTTKRKSLYAELKIKWSLEVQTRALLARLKKGCIPAAHFTFLHFERDQLRDPDNLSGGAQKLLLDGLKDAQLIANDGWKHVLGIRHHWVCEPPDAPDGFQAVGVQLYAATDTLTFSEARDLAEPVERLVAMIPRASEERQKRARRSKGAAGFARAGLEHGVDRGLFARR